MLKPLLAALALIALGLAIRRIALGPVERLGQSRQWLAQFQLIDFICLLVYFQAILVGCLRFLPRDQLAAHLALGGTLFAATLVLWGGSVVVLSRAGIRDNRRRAVCLLIVVPGTVALILVSAVAVVSGMGLLFRVDYGLRSAVRLENIGLWLLGCFVGAWLLRPISWWVAQGGRVPPGEDGTPALRSGAPAPRM